MTTYSTYYDILGIKPNVDGPTIRKAYLKLSLQHHPDKNPDNVEDDSIITSEISSLILTNRRDREDRLVHLAGGRTSKRVRKSRYWTDRHEERSIILQTMTSLRADSNHQDSSTSRIVHVSDTHNMHRLMSSHLPSGDLFLHITGDICGYYDMQTDLR
jgi:hypothetical protein